MTESAKADLFENLARAGIVTESGTESMREKVRETLQIVADCHGVRVGTLTGQRRNKRSAAARRDAMAALRLLGLTFPEIGAALGGRDHSTIIAGIKKRREQRSVVGMLGGLGTDE